MRAKTVIISIITVILLTFGFVFFKQAASAKLKTGEKNLNIPYAKREGSAQNLTALDIYAPDGAKNAPVMIMIHGGGWANGDKANRGVWMNKVPFFNQEGFIFVSINYRLSPEVKHPAHIEDVAESVVWVYDNIAKYGGDKNKIFVMGHSAGAHLAALVATDDRRLKKHGKDLSVIKGAILLDGAGYDIPNRMSTSIPFAGILERMYKDAFTEDEPVQKDASPYYHVAKGKKIPPFLIFTAGSRIASNLQSEKLAKALNDAGSKAEVINDPDKNHGGINTQFGLPDEMITKKSKGFLDGILKR